MLNIFSVTIVTILFIAFIKSKDRDDNELVNFIISMFICIALLTNCGYFIKIGSQPIYYAEFMEIVLLLTLSFKSRGKSINPNYIIIAVLFFGSILLGEISTLVLKPTNVLVMKGIQFWDPEMLGISDYYTYPSVDFTNIQKVIRVLMFIIVAIKLSAYIKENKNYDLKKPFMISSYIYIISGFVDVVSKYIIHQPILEKFNALFFGVDSGQIADFVTRNGKESLVGFFKEPSHFALIAGFPLLIFFMLRKQKNIKENIMEILIVILIFISGSFISIGLIIYWLITKVYFFIKNKYKSILSIGIVFIFVPTILIFLSLYLSKSSYFLYYLQRISNLMSVDQLGYSSELTRITSIISSFNIFSKYFLFGIGLGGTTAHAFIPVLLSNIGIIGTCFYLMFINSFFRNTLNSISVEFYTFIPLWVIIGDIGYLYDEKLLVILLVLVVIKRYK